VSGSLLFRIAIAPAFGEDPLVLRTDVLFFSLGKTFGSAILSFEIVRRWRLKSGGSCPATSAWGHHRQNSAADTKTNIAFRRFGPRLWEKYLDAGSATSKGPNYLMEEIAARVAKAPIKFDWFAQIAQPSDKPDDPSTPWPENRELVKLGTLTITGMAADQEGLSRSLLCPPASNRSIL
jgi:hypothetical protein